MAVDTTENRRPFSHRDFDFFFCGLEQKRLLVQKCTTCATLRNPPGPGCPACRSLDWAPFELSGNGTVYSYTIHCHPSLPDFQVPHPIILAEMAEGIRMLAGADGTPPDRIEIGAPVVVEFIRRGNRDSFRFRLG